MSVPAASQPAAGPTGEQGRPFPGAEGSTVLASPPPVPGSGTAPDDGDVTARAAELREVVRRVIEDLWGGGDLSLVDELFHPDAVDHMPVPGQPPGLDGLREVVTSFHHAFPDLEMTLHQTLADVERSTAVDVWTFTGTHSGELAGLPAPTGRRVEFGGIDVMQVRDGKVAAMWHVEEMARLLQQLGADGPESPAGPGSGPA